MKENKEHIERANKLHGDCDICGEHSTLINDGICQKSACRNKAGEEVSCKSCSRAINSIVDGICDSHVCHRRLEEGKASVGDLIGDDLAGC